MAALPAPLVPPEVDLRDYGYIPLYGKKLFDSDTWNLCDEIEKIAALRLWWASWHQEPAGSLPNNDRLLCGMAGKGDVIKAWMAIKDNAMRGWILCSDGRLYHPVVASIALDVWGKKRKKNTDNAADRERKRRKRESLPPDKSKIPAENALKEKGKVEGKEEIKPATSENSAGAAGGGCPPDKTDAERVREQFLALRERFWPNNPNLSAPWSTIETEATGWLEQGGTVDVIRSIVERGMFEKATKGETAPLSLKAFKLSLQDGIAKATRPTAPQGRSVIEIHAQQEARRAAALAATA